MADLMKLVCLLACMIVAGPITLNAPITCGEINSSLTPCIGYLARSESLPRQCCDGFRNLNNMAHTAPDHQQACRFLQNVAKVIGSGLNPGRAAGLARACGLIVSYPFSISAN